MNVCIKLVLLLAIDPNLKT